MGLGRYIVSLDELVSRITVSDIPPRKVPEPLLYMVFDICADPLRQRQSFRVLEEGLV